MSFEKAKADVFDMQHYTMFIQPIMGRVDIDYQTLIHMILLTGFSVALLK